MAKRWPEAAYYTKERLEREGKRKSELLAI